MCRFEWRSSPLTCGSQPFWATAEIWPIFAIPKLVEHDVAADWGKVPSYPAGRTCDPAPADRRVAFDTLDRFAD